jgi:hypothetical protein
VSRVSLLPENWPDGFQPSAVREDCVKRQQKPGFAPTPHFQKGAPARGIDSSVEVPCNLRLSYRTMETSIKNQSGGTAAETTNINPNSEPNSEPNPDMNQINDEPATLKEISAMSDCAVSSLKNNIKSGNLAATQANDKAPYMVRPSDAERFLRATPGIASKFHPAAEKAVADPGQTPATPKVKAPEQAKDLAGPTHVNSAQAAAIPEVDVTAAEPVAAETAPAPKVETPTVAPSDPKKTDSPAAEPDSKRRRRRRRGKGGSSSQSAPHSPPFLKALVGTTPQERLRITACLNELAALVAFT